MLLTQHLRCQDGQPLPRRHFYTLSKDIPPDCSLLDPRAQWPGPIVLLKSLEKRQNHFRNVQYDIPPPPLQFNLKNQSQETCIFYVSTPRFQKQRKTAHNIILYPSCLSASAELKGGKKKKSLALSMNTQHRKLNVCYKEFLTGQQVALLVICFKHFCTGICTDWFSFPADVRRR